MGAFELGWQQGERRTEERQGRKDEERQAKLTNARTAGLTPEALDEYTESLYKKDPSALKQHVLNLLGRLRGQQPQPTPDAYPAQSATVGEAPLQVGGGMASSAPPAPQASAGDVSQFMAVPNAQGLAEPGNLPIWNRPVVQNADGSHSSEYSTSFEQDGKEVLVPTVVNGKFLTPDGKKPPEGSAAEEAM